VTRGPLVIESPSTTIVVDHEASAVKTPSGSLVIAPTGGKPRDTSGSSFGAADANGAGAHSRHGESVRSHFD
jgi:hypothetical protein